MERQVRFPVGGLSLEGLLSLPEEPAELGVVVCHPHPLYGGDMHNNVVAALVAAFREAGFATLRFNFRGVGESGGTHDDGRAEIDDVKAAVACLAGQCGDAEIAVAGYSFGAMVGLKAGADDPRVASLIGVALPIAARDPAFLKHVTKPKLLIAGDSDDYAPVDQLRALVEDLPEPKACVIVEGADHFFWGLEREVAEAAVAFLEE